MSIAVLCTASIWWLAAAIAQADAPPANAGDPPVISGNAQQGDTLTVSDGTWSNDPTDFAYAWEDCDGSGDNCMPITGATSSSYVLQPSDVGSTILAIVTASNDAGPAAAPSGVVGPVLPAAPAPGDPPVIGGIAQQGQTLTVGTGTWSNDPTTFSYTWEDCDSSGNDCAAIGGATSDTYTLQPADVGMTVVAEVTAVNAGGQNAATSAGVGPVLPLPPASIDPPVISGTTQQGEKLTVSTGTWSNDPTSFSYSWEDCDGSGDICVSITGATSSSYTLQQSDVDKTVVAQVIASNASGENPATSAAAGPVVPPPPAIITDPVITGTAQQGYTLNVSPGTWTNSPTAYGYVWQDCDGSGDNCTAITGATSSSYTLQASDVGQTVVAQVTASNEGGQNPSSSRATSTVLPAIPTVGTSPGISGTAQQGHTLTVSTGTWSNSPTKYSYDWQDCSAADSGCSSNGATSSTYTVQSGDIGKFVRVNVTASNLGGSAAVATTSVGPVLPPPPANTKLPVITSTRGTLSVSNGTWSTWVNDSTALSYAWEACSASGASCNPIPGATASSYALSAADIGTTLVCVVTDTGLGGSTSVPTTKTAIVTASDLPAASQATTTDLLATPSAPVTNQSVTLVATVTAGTSSTALWGTVTFENGGAPIHGCANMPAVPSGRSATVACTTSFAASTAQLSAVFSPSSGSILAGSSSPGTRLTVGADSSATALTASPSVTVGSSTTYTAAVAPPASRPGPVQPTGSVEFLDGQTPIASCANQPLSGGAASCTVRYAVAGAHQITAEYSGDANFRGSSSPADQVSAVPVPTTVLGTITATMQWAFYFTPKYTLVRDLVVNGVSPGARVIVRCQGHGCPFATHSSVLAGGKRCGRKAKRACLAPGTMNLTSTFAGRHLRVGARITVSIVRPSWVGKSYRFTVRARRGPRVQIGSLPVA